MKEPKSLKPERPNQEVLWCLFTGWSEGGLGTKSASLLGSTHAAKRANRPSPPNPHRLRDLDLRVSDIGTGKDGEDSQDDAPGKAS